VTSNSWYDPRNWDFGFAWNSNPRRLIPVPESDRVPCPGDYVKFPGNATFVVELGPDEAEIQTNSFDISVKSLHIGSGYAVFRATEEFDAYR
jgi:hypothetical protein